MADQAEIDSEDTLHFTSRQSPGTGPGDGGEALDGSVVQAEEAVQRL